VTGRPVRWEFHQRGTVVVANVTGRLVVNDLASKLAACVAGQGIAQTFALGVVALLERGELVQLLPDRSEERFPLYVYYPSRHLPPAKVRAFVDFIEEIVLSLRGLSAGNRRDVDGSLRSIEKR
jgi:DNA-binding transcriptional LysR family regulator